MRPALLSDIVDWARPCGDAMLPQPGPLSSVRPDRARVRQPIQPRRTRSSWPWKSRRVLGPPCGPPGPRSALSCPGEARRPRRRTPAPVSAGLAAVTALLFGAIGAAPAQGHTDLAGSSPTAGARLGDSPSELELRFTENISREFAQVSLTRGEQPAERLQVSTSGPVLTAAVPPPRAGTVPGRIAWTVSYRVVSADGHPITGTLEFTAPAGAQPNPSVSSSPPAAPNEDDSEARKAEASVGEDQGGAGSAGSVLAVSAVAGVALIATAAALILAARRRSQSPPA